MRPVRGAGGLEGMYQVWYDIGKREPRARAARARARSPSLSFSFSLSLFLPPSLSPSLLPQSLTPSLPPAVLPPSLPPFLFAPPTTPLSTSQVSGALKAVKQVIEIPFVQLLFAATACRFAAGYGM